MDAQLPWLHPHLCCIVLFVVLPDRVVLIPFCTNLFLAFDKRRTVMMAAQVPSAVVVPIIQTEKQHALDREKCRKTMEHQRTSTSRNNTSRHESNNHTRHQVSMLLEIRLVISTWDSPTSHISHSRSGAGFTPVVVVIVHPIPSFTIFIIEP
jgi:hypothetical protein